MQLESFVAGRWQAGAGGGSALRDATTGSVIANATAEGLDMGAVLEHARRVGGPNLRRLTFHERAAQLKALAKFLTEHKDEFYTLSYATGATKGDSWIDIDGGIGTLFVYASKGTRELPNSRVYVDGGVEALSKGGTFVAQHICVPLEGAAVHINAFNFPVWGMLEKLAPTLLAGVPAIVKPATQTSYLTERVFRRIIESGLLPEGAVQLICGGVGDLFEHLICQDAVSFTGSASTALRLRQHPAVSAHAVRFTAETDSLNASILGPDAVAGTPELELFVREVVREMTVKAGQKCTAIRRALVPAARSAEVLEALRAALGRVVMGDPRLEKVRMGPVASLAQRREVLEQLGRLKLEAEVVYGDGARPQLEGADAERGAFVAPTLRTAATPAAHARCTRWRPSARCAPCCPTRGSTTPSRSRAGAAGACRLDLQRRRRRGLAPGAGTGAVPRPRAGDQSRLRQGVDRARLAAAAPGARRPGTRRRRRGDGRHPRGAALHAAHGRAGHARSLHRGDRPLGEGARELDPGTHPFRKPFGRLASATLSTPPSAASPWRTSSASRRCRAIASMPTPTRRRRPATRCSGPRGARVFPGVGRGGAVRRSAVRAGARQLRHRCAAIHQAGQARRPHQGSSHLQGEVAAQRCRLRRSALGRRHHQPAGRDGASYDVLTMVSEKAVPGT